MANFPLDPTRWILEGHQIIDGGPTRLPRTYYTPSVVPPHRHDHICIAELMPPPPQQQEDLWRQQVRDFIVHQLPRAVDDVQPCLFGVRLFVLHSQAARPALIDHAPYQLQNGNFVRFLAHDDRQNHRVKVGLSTGWLMFLGLPLDYRNDYDIANAIGTFGKFMHWHQDPNVLERTLVYASYPTITKVPRYVVSRNYASVGGVREGWTAVCYILTTQFADALQTDDEPKPFDGNPHPMPGQMHMINNNIVGP